MTMDQNMLTITTTDVLGEKESLSLSPRTSQGGGPI